MEIENEESSHSEDLTCESESDSSFKDVNDPKNIDDIAAPSDLKFDNGNLYFYRS